MLDCIDRVGGCFHAALFHSARQSEDSDIKKLRRQCKLRVEVIVKSHEYMQATLRLEKICMQFVRPKLMRIVIIFRILSPTAAVSVQVVGHVAARAFPRRCRKWRQAILMAVSYQIRICFAETILVTGRTIIELTNICTGGTIPSLFSPSPRPLVI